MTDLKTVYDLAYATFFAEGMDVGHVWPNDGADRYALGVVAARALEDAAETARESWFTMNIANDEANAKLAHDWLMRRAQWVRGDEETYGLNPDNGTPV